MSSLNGFNGQQGRPGLRPTGEQPQTGHPNAAHGNNGAQQYPGHAPQAWQPQSTHYQQPTHQPPPHAQQPIQSQPPQQWPPQPPQPHYPQQGYGQNFPGAGDYGQPKAQPGFASQPSTSYGGLSPNPDAYAPSFEPYSPVSSGRPAHATQQPNAAAYAPQVPDYGSDYGNEPGYGTDTDYGQPHYGQQAQPAHNTYGQPQSSQWPAPQSYQQQPVTGGHGAYRQAEQHQHHVEPKFSDWPQAQPQAQPQPAHGQTALGYDYGDANGYHQPHQGAEHIDDMGFAQPAGGELDQGYAEDDGEEYEIEEPSSGRRPLMMAAALAGAIFVGGGMAYGYKAIFGSSASINPPMVKSASAPAKIKPADAGGKQFAHTDSKIMGRLGEGAAVESAVASNEVDANGTRKVSTLVVGRDGSIQAPAVAPVAAAPANDPAGNINVPGMMVVDALGGGHNNAAAAQPKPAVVAAVEPVAPQKLVVTPPAPPQKPVTIAKASVSDATGSIDPDVAAPVAPKQVAKKVAAAKSEVVNDAYTGSSVAPVTAPSGANGYVAVLASVPRSDSSRMTALKRFADMQQKYGSVLSGKTPDVAEANLGSKGAYHRLVVGPPASRQQASSLCSELKAQGYTDCWVTAY